MKMLGIAFSALAFVTLSASSQASNSPSFQTRCNLTEANAPNVRGLRLGMSAQQLLALFPGVAKKKEMKDAIDKAKSGGEGEPVYLVFDPATDGDAQQFAGVEAAAAAVHKGRVVDFTVQYGATWKSVDAWIAKLSEAFKLPGAQEWAEGPNEAPNKVLKCEGVMIEAAILGGGASLRILNSDYLKETESRARAAEEKKRKEIKP